jgi:hypothetical protein
VEDFQEVDVFFPDSASGMTGGTHPSVAGEGKGDTVSEEKENGSWAGSSIGPKGCPVAFNHFSLFLFHFFSVLLCYFAKNFNLKFETTF